MKKHVLSIVIPMITAALLTWVLVSTLVVRNWEDDERIAQVAVVITKHFGGSFGLPAAPLGLGLDGYRDFVGCAGNALGLLAGLVVGLLVALAAAIRNLAMAAREEPKK